MLRISRLDLTTFCSGTMFTKDMDLRKAGTPCTLRSLLVVSPISQMDNQQKIIDEQQQTIQEDERLAQLRQERILLLQQINHEYREMIDQKQQLEKQQKLHYYCRCVIAAIVGGSVTWLWSHCSC
ncbi:hypothetical protein M3Y98_00631400 [Aphelenchoides besseyi]|nr:hypothetical protein M3Y98_00631300 [Aphelenchoides besseyi]KAI6179633.1 hypothetical protein M3Y98_00631400 [Aphelenchoides besseyi]